MKLVICWEWVVFSGTIICSGHEFFGYLGKSRLLHALDLLDSGNIHVLVTNHSLM